MVPNAWLSAWWSTAFSLLIAFLVLSSSDHQAYQLFGPKWPSSPVKYYVNPTNADGIDPGSVVAAIEEGALAWSVQSNADLAFEYDGLTTATELGNDQTNEVIFREAISENGSGVIATAYTWYIPATGTIVDSDIVFWDDAFTFFVGNLGCSLGYYIEDIAAHEFGHSAGIGHSVVPFATMYSSVPYCSKDPRSLLGDDLDAIEALYPPSSVPTAPADPTAFSANLGADPYSSIDLTWQDNSEDETAFLVERSTDGQSFSLIDTLSLDATTYSDTSLESGTTYYYHVMATNNAGPSGPSNMATATTSSPAQPPAQSDPPGSPSPGNNDTGVDRNADLSWSEVAGATYDVYFGKENPTPPYRSGLTSPSLRLRKLSPGTTYYLDGLCRD